MSLSISVIIRFQAKKCASFITGFGPWLYGPCLAPALCPLTPFSDFGKKIIQHGDSFGKKKFFNYFFKYIKIIYIFLFFKNLFL